MSSNNNGYGPLYVYATGPCEGWESLQEAGDWLAAAGASVVGRPIERLLEAHLAVVRHPKWVDDAGVPKVSVLPGREYQGHLFFLWKVEDDTTLVVSPVRLPWLDWTDGGDDESLTEWTR